MIAKADEVKRSLEAQGERGAAERQSAVILKVGWWEFEKSYSNTIINIST